MMGMALRTESGGDDSLGQWKGGTLSIDGKRFGNRLINFKRPLKKG